MKKLTLLLLFIVQLTWANNLSIANVVKTSDNQLRFDISWDNSWRVSDYYDAVWIFVKYKNSTEQWQHLDITTTGASSGFAGFKTFDDKGLMIYRNSSNTGIGTMTGTIDINFDSSTIGSFPDFKVFGIEMVYINEGAFFVGDGVSANRFYQGDDDTLPYYVQDSNEITVGNTSNDINGLNLTNNIPSTYPTGFDSFYLMKYEVSQEQYIAFLNTLTPAQQQSRTQSDLSAISSANRFVMYPVTGSNIPGRKNSIACDATATNTSPITFYNDLNNNGIPNESDDGQNIACNYLTFNDNLAYLEWAAMRPITDMEFEKATRGPAYPIASDVANGTNSVTGLASLTNSGQINESVSNINTDGLSNYNIGFPIRVGALANSTSTRLQSGGSFYGVMDLTGNVIELSVNTINSALNYSYIFGSGSLDTNGFSTSWNGDFTNCALKGGGYYGNSIPTSFNSYRGFLSDFNFIDNYSSSAFGIRGAR